MSNPASDAHVPILCRDNIDCIEQLLRVIDSLSDVQYTQSVAPCNSGIGVHFRHILDHYDAFLAGLNNGLVDYDARDRDAHTEMSRSTARQRLFSVSERLAAVDEQSLSRALDVRMDCGSNCDISAPSSVSRELQFLVSHTVHHDALIAAAAKSLGVAMEPGYGVAPSTLRYARGGPQSV